MVKAAVVDVDTLPVISALRIFLGAFATWGNLFILYLFYLCPRLRNNAYTTLVGLLSLSNAIVGIGLLIRGIFTAIASAQGIKQYDKGTCYAVNSLIGIGKTASEVIILGIAVERLKAVYNPFSYGNGKQNILVFTTSLIAVAMAVIVTYGKQIGVDRSVLIPICTAGMATGPYTLIFSTLYSGVFLAILYCKLLYIIQLLNLSVPAVYFLSLIFLAKIKWSSSLVSKSHQFKSQTRMFIQFFLVMLNYTIFFGIPFIFSLLVLVGFLEINLFKLGI